MAPLRIRSIPGLVWLLLLAACATAPPVLQVTAPAATTLPIPSPARLPLTPTPRPSATPSPFPTLSLTPSPTSSRTPFPRNLDHYLLVYDPQATADIPIRRPLGFDIWGTKIPARPIEGTPQFINHPVPSGLTALGSDRLVQAGCSVPYSYHAECSPDSPLAHFDCTEVGYYEWIYDQPQKDLTLVGTCWKETDDWEVSAEDWLYLTGCAFRRKVGYFFLSGNEYVLVNHQADLRKRFAPIESASEAIGYAQLATGLQADFGLSFEPYLLYLQDRIEDTQAIREGDGYRINLYYRPGCSCEPYVYSEIILQVGRDGSVAWLTAKPFALTTGFSCGD